MRLFLESKNRGKLRLHIEEGQAKYMANFKFHQHVNITFRIEIIPENRANEGQFADMTSFAKLGCSQDISGRRLIGISFDLVKGRLTKAVQELAKMAPEISEVWLFGSLVRGQAVPGSDADVLLILEECKLPFLERAAYYQPEFCGVGVDLFAYTRKELEHMERAGHQFLERVKSERICLFKRKKGLEVLKSSQLILRYHPSALGMKPSRVWLCGNHTYQIPENDSKGSSKISALR